MQSVYVGSGVVGGTMMSIDNLARNTADVAIRLLNGAPPRSVKLPPQRPGQPVFDWRELQRWSIAESRLPAGSVVLSGQYGPNTARTVLSAVAAVRQSLLIIGLLPAPRTCAGRSGAEGTWRSPLTPAVVRRCRR
jgi:hypothetical protein